MQNIEGRRWIYTPFCVGETDLYRILHVGGWFMQNVEGGRLIYAEF